MPAERGGIVSGGKRKCDYDGSWDSSDAAAAATASGLDKKARLQSSHWSGLQGCLAHPAQQQQQHNGFGVDANRTQFALVANYSSNYSSRRHDETNSSGYDSSISRYGINISSSSSGGSRQYGGASYISKVISKAASLYESSPSSPLTGPDRSHTSTDGPYAKKAPYQLDRSDGYWSNSSEKYDDDYDDYDRHKARHREKSSSSQLSDPFCILSDAYLRFDDILVGSEEDGRALRSHATYAVATLALTLKLAGYCGLLDSHYIAASTLTIVVCCGYSLVYLMKIVCV